MVANDSIQKRVQKPKRLVGIAAVVIAVAVMVAVGFLIVKGNRDPVVVVSDTDMHIQGMYGLKVGFADIENITLIERSMSDIGIGIRTNGYGGFSNALKGHFRSDTLGEIMLFVQKNSSPTILIERKEQKAIYISLSDSEATRTLYSELLRSFSP